MFRRVVRTTIIAVSMLMAVPVTAADWLELTNLTLIDGSGDPPHAVSNLLIRKGIIVAIDGQPTTVGPGELDVLTTIDLGGAFVIPGLIDTHVHLANYPRGRDHLAERLQWALRGGVTTLRDLGGDARVLADARRAILVGELTGPNLRFSALFGGATMFDNPVIGQAARGFDRGDAPWMRAASGDVDLAAIVAMARGAGVSAIKLYGDLDRERAAAITREALDQGLMVWAHATVFPARPSELVAAGVQSLSHAPYLVWEAVDEVPADYRARTAGPYSEIAPDHPRIITLLEQMAAKNVVLDATLSMYRDMHRYRPPEGIEWATEAFEWGVEVTRLAHRYQVPISVGTDAFSPPNPLAPPNTHVELETLVEDVGLSPMEALVAATRNGALAAGVAGVRGTIAVGMAADLVVLRADPLADIGQTRNIRFVVANGRLIDSVPFWQRRRDLP